MSTWWIRAQVENRRELPGSLVLDAHPRMRGTDFFQDLCAQGAEIARSRRHVHAATQARLRALEEVSDISSIEAMLRVAMCKRGRVPRALAGPCFAVERNC